MMLKAIVFAVLAVAVLADNFSISDDKRAQLREILRIQCEKNNAGDNVEQVEQTIKTFTDCINGFIDEATLRREIEEAKPYGALDQVLKKYCDKTPELKTCLYNLLDGVSPCIDANMREQMDLLKNGTNQLIDFICYMDGVRIVLFIAEGGPECLHSKTDEIKSCANSFPSSEAAKALTLTEQCAKINELATCIVNKLEGCTTSTPSNMVESLFKFVRKGSPCP